MTFIKVDGDDVVTWHLFLGQKGREEKKEKKKGLGTVEHESR